MEQEWRGKHLLRKQCRLWETLGIKPGWCLTELFSQQFNCVITIILAGSQSSTENRYRRSYKVHWNGFRNTEDSRGPNLKPGRLGYQSRHTCCLASNKFSATNLNLEKLFAELNALVILSLHYFHPNDY